MNDQTEPITKEEFGLWLHDERTKYVMELLRETRGEWLERLLAMENIVKSADITAQEIQRAKGIIYGIDLFLEIEWRE